MMQFTSPAGIASSKHPGQNSPSQKPSLSPMDLAEMQDWLAHLPIEDEQIRAQIAKSLNILQRSHQIA